MAANTSTIDSPWRALFEEVRSRSKNERDEHGVLGSINWLRQQMATRGANPNVVRNIIYRDKGKLSDKQALLAILKELWKRYCDAPLQVPELEALLSAGGGVEQEIAQLLGREKRRAYSAFVSGVRGDQAPKLLVTGRPGSGKTLLLDYVQQALELPPKAPDSVERLEFSSRDLSAALTRLALALGVPRSVIETKLVKVTAQGAFAVQADAQADVARTLLEAAGRYKGTAVLLLHLSQSLLEERTLGETPLRLNTADVPRVSAAEWVWLSLLEPLSHLPNFSLLVSMASVPARVVQRLGAFESPVKLNPPTSAEARRFVKARLPNLSTAQQETLLQRAGRSFEELRTLTLLADIRETLPDGVSEGISERQDREHVAQLSALVDTAGNAAVRDFLAAAAVLSLPDYPTFTLEALGAVRDSGAALSSVEAAFLDPIPASENTYRCFSRQLTRQLRERLQRQPERYRRLNAAAAHYYVTQARQVGSGDETARYLYHLFEARDWTALLTWLGNGSVPQTLLRRLWQAAETELAAGETFEAVALQVAAHYVRLGSYEHPDAERAFGVLATSEKEDIRLWTLLKRAEGQVAEGQVEQVEALLGGWTQTDDPLLNAERALVQASAARWRGSLSEAAERVAEARPLAARLSPVDAASRLVRTKVAVWAGLVAKDRGDLETALSEFESASPEDDLVGARVAFQKGDVLLRLGRFDAALVALTRAVQGAYRSEALTQEQARYLSRRARLCRLRSELDAAGEDFTAALHLLEKGAGLEQTFWRAKLSDERALYLLAVGAFDEAIFALKHSRDVFTRFEQATGVDASYRVLRSGLRLALAYALRGAGRTSVWAPLDEAIMRESPDLLHARQLTRTLTKQVEGTGSAYGTLRRQAYLLNSVLTADPQEAVSWVERAFTHISTSYPQQEAESCAYLASAQLRFGEPERTLEAVGRARAVLKPLQGKNERGDLGLQARLSGLEVQALLVKDEVEKAAAALEAYLQNPDFGAYATALLRDIGEAAEKHLGEKARHHPALTQRFGEVLSDASVRFADALVLSWQTPEVRERLLATAQVA